MSRLLTVPYIFPTVLRDISERGRDLEQILSQYITFVKPAFEEFCLPVSKESDTHGSPPKMLHTLPGFSARSVLCLRAQVSLPCLAPTLQALAKNGGASAGRAGQDGDYLYSHCVPGEITLPCGKAKVARETPP